MNKQLRGSLSLFGAVIIWGSAFIAQSVGMELIGPFTFQAIRCGLAVLFLIPVSFLFDRKPDAVKRWLEPKLWKSGIICGLALFVAASLQQVGLVYTDAGKAGFLTAMYIVLVPVLGLFLGQKPGKFAWFSVGLAVVGLYLLSCMGVSEINIGDILLAGCALAYAVQITLIDRCAGELDGFRLNCVQALVVTVLSIPFVAFTESIHMESILACWMPLCYAGIASMGIAYSLQIIGQQHLEPAPASLIMSLESVIAALSGWALLGERMTAVELCGCALVFLGVVLSQLPAQKIPS